LIDLLSSYNSIAEEYEQLFPNFQATVSIWEIRLKDFFRQQSCKPILDIGCGIGIQSIILAQQGLKVFAIDISDQMIEKGRKLARIHNQNVTFIQGDCRKLEAILPNKLSFNGFLCCGSAILHLSPNDIKELIQQLYNLLNVGSKGIIEFFNWSLIEPEKLKWSPRSHFRNDDIEIFSIEFFYNKDKQVNSSIILFTRNWKNNGLWQIKTQSDFTYWKYLPEEISEKFIEGGFKLLDFSKGTKNDPTSIIMLKK
jgi:SAM-dependent methyltransferase